jgi:CAAX protease family protein
MPRKKPNIDSILTRLRQIDAVLSQGGTLALACKAAGVSERSYHRWKQAYAEPRPAQAATSGKLALAPGDLRPLTILTVVPLCLIFIHYFGDTDWLAWFLGSLGLDRLSAGFRHSFGGTNPRDLPPLLWWAGISVAGYVVVPVLLIRVVWRQRLADYGVRWAADWPTLRPYVAFVALMVPVIWAASSTRQFQDTYPFLIMFPGESIRSRWMLWEAAYFAQFFALEFFFRGFMVLGLKQRFGWLAIPVMTVPYCMIHFAKPMPEAVAAIVAGIALGHLSMKSGTVFWGALLHCTVAMSFDVAVLLHRGAFAM